jgi:hypothetical protein
MAAVRKRSLVFSVTAITNKMLDLGMLDLPRRHVMNIPTNYARSIAC